MPGRRAPTPRGGGPPRPRPRRWLPSRLRRRAATAAPVPPSRRATSGTSRTMSDVSVIDGLPLKDAARDRARKACSTPAFMSLPLADQQKVYTSLVQEYMDDEREKRGLARSMATDSGKDMGYKGYDPGFTGDTRAFTDLVESVDFPKFVGDLLKSVFDANLVVMKQQT